MFMHFGFRCRREAAAGEKRMMHLPPLALVGQFLQCEGRFAIDQVKDNLPVNPAGAPLTFSQQDIMRIMLQYYCHLLACNCFL